MVDVVWCACLLDCWVLASLFSCVGDAPAHNMLHIPMRGPLCPSFPVLTTTDRCLSLVGFFLPHRHARRASSLLLVAAAVMMAVRVHARCAPCLGLHR